MPKKSKNKIKNKKKDDKKVKPNKLNGQENEMVSATTSVVSKIITIPKSSDINTQIQNNKSVTNIINTSNSQSTLSSSYHPYKKNRNEFIKEESQDDAIIHQSSTTTVSASLARSSKHSIKDDTLGLRAIHDALIQIDKYIKVTGEKVKREGKEKERDWSLFIWNSKAKIGVKLGFLQSIQKYFYQINVNKKAYNLNDGGLVWSCKLETDTSLASLTQPQFYDSLDDAWNKFIKPNISTKDFKDMRVGAHNEHELKSLSYYIGSQNISIGGILIDLLFDNKNTHMTVTPYDKILKNDSDVKYLLHDILSIYSKKINISH